MLYFVPYFFCILLAGSYLSSVFGTMGEALTKTVTVPLPRARKKGEHSTTLGRGIIPSGHHHNHHYHHHRLCHHLHSKRPSIQPVLVSGSSLMLANNSLCMRGHHPYRAWEWDPLIIPDGYHHHHHHGNSLSHYLRWSEAKIGSLLKLSPGSVQAFGSLHIKVTFLTQIETSGIVKINTCKSFARA